MKEMAGSLQEIRAWRGEQERPPGNESEQGCYGNSS